MASGTSALYFMDESGYSVNSTVVGLRSELGHQEEVEMLDICVDPFGNNLLKQFFDALHEHYQSVCFRDAIIGLLGFVNNYYCCFFPWMCTLLQTSIEYVWKVYKL